MKAVLLAAGKGKRLWPYTKDKQKALVEVQGAPLIEYSINFVKDFVDHIYIVGGYYYDLLHKYCQKQELPISLIKNADYNHGSILTIEKVLPFINETFVLMNIDHIYPKGFAPKIFRKIHGITTCCDFDRNLSNDDMKVQTNKNQLIAISKTLEKFDGGYIGISLIHASSLPAYIQTVENLLKNPDYKDYNVENILQKMIEHTYPIFIRDCSGSQWIEIDSSEDLEYANSFSFEELNTGSRSSE